MVRLSQSWVMRYPLIDWHGNNGNIAGDGPAAARYTEARLTKLAEEGMLNGIKKKNVDFIPNYSEDADEPITLPSGFPNLLCNPNSGIGVAMACNWLPHNFREVAQAINDYMDGKEPMLPGPDFPGGGEVINAKDMPMISRTGHGSVKVRGRYKIEKGTNIVFYEIPYGTTIEGLLTQIGEVCDSKEIEGVSDVRDESNKKGLRIVIVCQKGIDPDSIAKKLFLKTDLQTSISYNQVALIDKTPTELNLKQCIEIYIKHNIDCLVKETNFDLEKAQARLEIVNGLLRALEDIDNIIAFIKKSASATIAKDGLISQYKFTEPQAKAIVDMKLGRLAGLEKVELQQEKTDLDKAVEEFKSLLSSEDKQKETIRTRLNDLVKKFGDDRRTVLSNIETPKEEKEIETVTPEDVVVVMTKSGEIKRIAKSAFKVQRKGGKGVKTEDDAILGTIATNTIDNLLLFTNTGKMFRMLVDNVPAGTNVSKGVGIGSLINMEPTEKVIAITSLERKNNAKYVVFITKNGLLKKTALEEYNVKRSTGIVAIKLKDGDSIANIELMDEEEMVVVTKNGQAIHIETKDVAPIGRNTSGIKAIKLKDGDEVIAGLPVRNSNQMVAVFLEQGQGKKSALSEFPLQGKNGVGVKCSSGMSVVGAEMISDEDTILIIGKTTICFSAAEIPILGRTAAGNMMIKTGIIKSVVKL